MSKEIEENKTDAISKELELEELENVVGGTNGAEIKDKTLRAPNLPGQFEPFA